MRIRTQVIVLACLLVGSATAVTAKASYASAAQPSEAPTDLSTVQPQPAAEDSSGGHAQAGPQAAPEPRVGPPAASPAGTSPPVGLLPWGAQEAIYNKFGWPPSAPPFAPGTIIPPPPPGQPAPQGPPAPPPTELAFMVMGDWGGQDDWPMTTVAQTQCAAALSRAAEYIHPQFIVSTGDNFYETGINGPAEGTSAQSRFQVTWSDVYNQYHSLSGLPWYVIAGNHDWEGNVTAEVAMTEYLEGWVFPSLWYTFTYSIPMSSQTVQFVMLDTETLTGGDAGQPDFDIGTNPPPINETQWEWVENTLNTSTADWIIVVGHFPVLSAGENGPTPYLVERLLPMLARANVALYFSGHDHQLEHIGPSFWPTPYNVDFVVSGAGAKFNYSKDHIDDIPAGSLRYQYNQGCGFVSVKVTHETFEQSALEVSFWSGSDMMPIYSFTKMNPRSAFVPPGPPAPPAPGRFYRYDSPSNRVAVFVGIIGLGIGGVMVWGGIGQAVLSARGDDPMAGGAAGEKAGLLMSQKPTTRPYGGTVSSMSAASGLQNRL